jgi:hypothetical protein
LHVLLGLLVLLLEKTLPVVLVPHPFGLALVVGHTRLNVSFRFCAKGFASTKDCFAARRVRFDQTANLRVNCTVTTGALQDFSA